jgi:hypothetical protein
MENTILSGFLNSMACSVDDITAFFTTSTRDGNDAANKSREKLLPIINDPPSEFLQDPEHGAKWTTAHQEWKSILSKIAVDTGIPEYTSTKVELKGGRKFNYDADVTFCSEAGIIASRKIEFKNGGTNINELPQFLSLPAKSPIFSDKYPEFWYDHYLDAYLAVDPEITLPKPPREEYLQNVIKTNYDCTPFFAQLKARELTLQKEKNKVVNQSITDYLTQHAASIQLDLFTEKVKETQSDKLYVLWSKGKFYLDSISHQEMANLQFQSVKNGNVVLVKGESSTVYSLLLRWRNHKGILNPAWQISMKRK